MSNATDRSIVRELAGQVAEIAALPVQEEKRRLWRKLNALTPERPMVMMDQVCWSLTPPRSTAPLRHEETQTPHPLQRASLTMATPSTPGEMA